MKNTITSQLNTEELYRLATDTIEYCNDGEILTSGHNHIGLTFHVDNDNFFELSDGKIYLHMKDQKNRDLAKCTLITPGTMEKLFHLFESMSDHYKSSAGEDNDDDKLSNDMINQNFRMIANIQGNMLNIAKNHNERLISLSRAVGQIEDKFAEKGIFVGEYDMSDLDEE